MHVVVAGLYDSSYWVSWFLLGIVMNTLVSLVLILSGLAFQLRFFVDNAFGLYFFLFILFSMAMVAFIFFLSVFMSHAKTSSMCHVRCFAVHDNQCLFGCLSCAIALVGFLVFLLGILVQSFSSFVYKEVSFQS